MADSTLQINLTLNDDASGSLVTALKSISSSANTAAQSHDNLNKKTTDTNNNWLKLSITTAAIIRIYRDLSAQINDVVTVGRQIDPALNDSFNNFQIAIQRVYQSISQQLAPALKVALDWWTQLLSKNFNNQNEALKDYNDELKQAQESIRVLNDLLDITTGPERRKEIEDQINMQMLQIQTINKMIAAHKDNNQSLYDENLLITASNQALNDYKNRQSQIDTEFVAGKMIAINYYNALLTSGQSAIAQNTIMATSFKQLAQLQAQLGNQELMGAENRNTQEINLLKFYQQEYTTAHQGMAALTVTLSQSIQTNLSSAVAGIASGSETAKQEFTALGQAMIQSIVGFMAQKAIAWALDSTILAGTVAASVASGSAVAAAWAPAAAMVSLASFGANGVPAAAAIASVTGLASSLSAASSSFAGFGGGGSPAGGATGSFAVGTSNVPSDMMAQIHQGETIVPQTFADAIRAGQLTLSGPKGSTGGTNGGINIYIMNPKMGSNQDVTQVAQQLGYKLNSLLRTGGGH